MQLFCLCSEPAGAEQEQMIPADPLQEWSGDHIRRDVLPALSIPALVWVFIWHRHHLMMLVFIFQSSCEFTWNICLITFSKGSSAEHAGRNSALQLFDGAYFWHKSLFFPVHTLAVGCSVPLLGREVSVVLLSSALITEPFLSNDSGVGQVLQSRNIIICVPRPFLQSQPPHTFLSCVLKTQGEFYVPYFPKFTYPYHPASWYSWSSWSRVFLCWLSSCVDAKQGLHCPRTFLHILYLVAAI